jgi:hypothetical protein
MSTSSPPKRSVVWLDLEDKYMRDSYQSSQSSPLSPIPSRHRVAPSPSPWIDLRSNASAADEESVYTRSETFETIDNDGSDRYSRYAPSSAWEIASEYEKGGFPIPFQTYQRFSRGMSEILSRNEKESTSRRTSLKAPSLGKPEEDSNISYPGRLRLFFILVSLSLSMFVVSLDRTIIAPAM